MTTMEFVNFPTYATVILLLSLCLITAGHDAMAYETDRQVPSGPNRAEPPETHPPPKPKNFKFKRLGVAGDFDVKRVVPSGPNAQESPDPPVLDVKRLVPSGPNGQQPPDAPSFGEVKRLVPSGPNAQQSPDPPSFDEIKRLVPSGPNAQESPDSPPKPENLVYFQSNGFEQSPPGF